MYQEFVARYSEVHHKKFQEKTMNILQITAIYACYIIM